METTVSIMSARIHFEPSTGFLGSSADTVPEPVTLFVLAAGDGPGGTRRYTLSAGDEGDSSQLQVVAETDDFAKISSFCAAVFACCGRPSMAKQVGFGFTAHRNKLSRLLDPAGRDDVERETLCKVAGAEDRGIRIQFGRSGIPTDTVCYLSGSLSSAALHSLAGAFRDMAAQRAEVRS